jgi:transketolase
LFSVQPLDRDTLKQAARATEGRLVTVEDHYRRGGFGESIVAALGEAGIPLRARILAVGDIPRSGSPNALLDLFGISAAHIAKAARALL